MTTPTEDDPLTWAGALALNIETTGLEELRAAWEGEAGKRHRDALRQSSPGILAQLAGHVRERVAAIKASQATVH